MPDTINTTGATLIDPVPTASPDFTRTSVHELAKLRTRCRDLVGSDVTSGTDEIHAKAEEYLPKWAAEDADTYGVRSVMTELMPGLERCVIAARGLVFGKPPTLTDTASAAIKAHWEDIDGAGTHARVWLREPFTDGLLDGMCAILVDFPKVPGAGTLDIGEFADRNLRPHWIRIAADQIINWRLAKINNQLVPTLLVIAEEVDEEVDEFGVQAVAQYRAFRLVDTSLTPLAGAEGETEMPTNRYQVQFRVWRKTEEVEGDKKVIKWYVHEEGVIRGQERIPIAVGYFNTKSAPFVVKPPLLALADVNLGHYRVAADRRYLMSIAHTPTFVVEGWQDRIASDGQVIQEDIVLGPGAAMKLPPGATAKWVQADPEGLDASKEELDDLKELMGALSVAFLAHERRAQETARAHSINAAAQNATLATAADGLRDCVEQALVFHARYIEDTPPTVTVNTSYEESTLDAQTISALSKLAKERNLTLRTLLLILQRGKIIPAEVDLDDEEANLLAEEAARVVEDALEEEDEGGMEGEGGDDEAADRPGRAGGGRLA